jgi:hypothetical protein
VFRRYSVHTLSFPVGPFELKFYPVLNAIVPQHMQVRDRAFASLYFPRSWSIFNANKSFAAPTPAECPEIGSHSFRSSGVSA